MKRIIQYSIVVFSLLLTTNLIAQTAANALWDLMADSTAVATGEIVAPDQSKTADLFVKDYTGGAMTSNAQRLHCQPWPGKELTPVYTRYVQFQVSPKPGNNLTVTKVSYMKGAYGTHGKMHANVWYAWNAGFDGVEIDTTGQTNHPDVSDLPYGIPDVRDNECPIQERTLNVEIADGETFYLRFFPWYSHDVANAGKYFVLQNVFIEGTTTAATAVEEQTLPTKFSLDQNYPNPFNPTTNIQFAIPEAGNYSLRVYNLLGQEVAALVNGELTAGIHNVTFDASNLTSGMYIYKLTGSNVNISKKMLLMK